MLIQENDLPKKKFISWSAIWIGALVGIGLGFLLQLFGSAIGLSVFTTHNGALTVAVGGVIGFLIAMVASMFAAGYAAGYLGRAFSQERSVGLLYGFSTWTLALILSAVLMGYVGKYVGMYAQTMAQNGVVVTVADNSVVQHFSSSDNQQTEATNHHHPSPQVNLSAKDLTWMALITFIMFFIGAAASCAGSLYGMRGRVKE